MFINVLTNSGYKCKIKVLVGIEGKWFLNIFKPSRCKYYGEIGMNRGYGQNYNIPHQFYNARLAPSRVFQKFKSESDTLQIKKEDEVRKVAFSYLEALVDTPQSILIKMRRLAERNNKRKDGVVIINMGERELSQLTQYMRIVKAMCGHYRKEIDPSQFPNTYAYEKTIDYIQRVERSINLELPGLESRTPQQTQVQLTERTILVSAGLIFFPLFIQYGLSAFDDKDIEKQNKFLSFIRTFCYFYPVKEDFDLITNNPPAVEDIREAIYA